MRGIARNCNDVTELMSDGKPLDNLADRQPLDSLRGLAILYD
jgi:hypothetical protein